MAYVQYPDIHAPTASAPYQQISSPKNQDVIVNVPNDLKSRRNHDINFRLQWGPEVTLDMEGLGYSREQEVARTTALNGVIDPSFFQQDSYSAPFFAAIKANNAVYRVTYQVFFTFLAFAAGILISFAMAMLMATAEFSNQFIFRPLFRMIRIYAGFFVFGSQITYECLRPVMALIMPWNKQ